MDVLLGEDETLPGKRLALICKHCRLVNGQAPPGVKRMEDVGKWRCAGCGTMNGEDNEVKKLVESIKNEAPVTEEESSIRPSKTGEVQKSSEKEEVEDEESDVTQYSSEEEATKTPAEAETPRRRSTRQRGKKRTSSTM